MYTDSGGLTPLSATIARLREIINTLQANPSLSTVEYQQLVAAIGEYNRLTGENLTPTVSEPKEETATKSTSSFNPVVSSSNPATMTTDDIQKLIDAALAKQQAQFTSQNSAAAALEEARKLEQQEDAIAALTKMFESYDLGSLAPKIIELVKKGYSSDTVTLLLQDTDAYKQRFAANEVRRKAGIAILSPAEYLATERAYRQIMNAAGLPQGFFDQNDDFTNLIAKDVSPGELQGRVQAAADAVLNADPYYTSALRDMYGMTNGDMIAFVLNPDRSLPLIQQKANAVAFGAAGQRQGYTNIDATTAEKFAGLGVSKQQAEQGFAQVATILPRTEQLGQIYGGDYDQMDALDETFANDATATMKRRKLVQSETDSFSGGSGVRSGSLGQASQGLI